MDMKYSLCSLADVVELSFSLLIFINLPGFTDFYLYSNILSIVWVTVKVDIDVFALVYSALCPRRTKKACFKVFTITVSHLLKEQKFNNASS